MPKLKTLSSAKKRFSYTASGKIKITQAGKRHNMRKRSNRQIREARGSIIASDSSFKLISKYLLKAFARKKKFRVS
jgi:large subunit ribosomal protein L35